MTKKFIESICLKDQQYQNLGAHQLRIVETFAHFFPEHQPHVLTSILPKIELDGYYKVRVVYDANTADVEYVSYQKRAITSLKLVETPPIDYAFKYEDRGKINRLVEASQADDIIICVNGLVTDSSYANLAFWDGENWLTPSTPLLKGTKRSHLLSQGMIKEAPIKASTLNQFTKVSLINAMLDLGDLELPTSRISY